MARTLIHRDAKPVYTCRTCVNSVPMSGLLYCPVFLITVKPGDKACIYRDVKK